MVNPVTLEDSVTISPDAVFRELGGEAVILNMATGVYFGLDPVGTRIWNLIHEHGALNKVFEILKEEFDAAPNALQEDLLRLVGELCGGRLASVSPRRE